MQVLRTWAGQFVDLTKVQFRVGKDGGHHPGDIRRSDRVGLAPPNGSSIWPRSRMVMLASVKKVSRKMVGRIVTTGSPDHASTCSPSQCWRCWRLGLVCWMSISETVIWDI